MNKNSLLQKTRIILALTGKDILDALKNKVTISLLATALFLLLFYMFLPNLESEPVIRLYDAGGSAWTPSLVNSEPVRVSEYDSQAGLQYRISRSGNRELGLVLPPGFDEMVNAGEEIDLQGYLLRWVNEEETAEILAGAEAQVAGVIGVPVHIQVERLPMLPESTGAGFTIAAGIMLLVMMIGMLLVPNLMIEEKRLRTLDALLVSPASAGQITLAKALTGFVYCLFGFGLGCLFNAYLVAQWELTLLSGICAALFSVSLGLLLGVLVENRQQLSLWANLLIIPLFVPVFLSIMDDLFPAWLIAIFRWLPMTAALDLLRASFTPRVGFAFIAPRLAVIALSCTLLLGIIAWKIKRSDRS